jgi:hypothetical protein
MVTKRSDAKQTPKPSKHPASNKGVSLDPTLTADIIAIGRRMPRSELANIPRDASTRFDDYIEDPR